jgi:hypothetical protein
MAKILTELVSAQVEVNRAVWAQNDYQFRHGVSPDAYIKLCVTNAIKELTTVLNKLDKQKKK